MAPGLPSQLASESQRRLSHDLGVFLLALGAGFPAVAVSMILIWGGDYTPKVQWTLSLVILGCWLGLSLSVRELDLLAALARREGKIVAREELYETVWGAPLRGQDRSVDVYVHKLRTKLADALPEWGFIHTHFGFGYRLSSE